MPEGPEIRRAADRVAKAVVGVPLREVFFGQPRLGAFAEPLSASRVCDVETRGKAMLTHFDCGLTVYSHNQLYGRWYVCKAGRVPSTRRQLRFAVHAQEHSALLYSASEIEVVPSDELTSIPFIARVGPDCLAPSLRPSAVTKRLLSRSFSRRKLGHLLLDQSFIAGVGNYLRSEILFEAHVHPDLRGADLDHAQARALGKAIVHICRRAYRTGGITNAPNIVRRLKNDGWTRSAYRHFVFRRGGEPCHVCNAGIVASEVAGRHLALCPGCQKKP